MYFLPIRVLLNSHQQHSLHFETSGDVCKAHDPAASVLPWNDTRSRLLTVGYLMKESHVACIEYLLLRSDSGLQKAASCDTVPFVKDARTAFFSFYKLCYLISSFSVYHTYWSVPKQFFKPYF
jgi:hypothetical protein